MPYAHLKFSPSNYIKPTISDSASSDTFSYDLPVLECQYRPNFQTRRIFPHFGRCEWLFQCDRFCQTGRRCRRMGHIGNGCVMEYISLKLHNSSSKLYQSFFIWSTLVSFSIRPTRTNPMYTLYMMTLTWLTSSNNFPASLIYDFVIIYSHFSSFSRILPRYTAPYALIAPHSVIESSALPDIWIPVSQTSAPLAKN